MKACVVSLGCPKNLTDSEVLMGQLACCGYKLVTNPKKADLIIVNTCAFLKTARDESLATIKDAIKHKKTGAKVMVAGCLPKHHKNLRLNAAVRFGNRDVQSLVSNNSINSIALFDSHTPRIKATHPLTAYVKIAEGCNNRCSYCLIPKIRGKLKVRPVNDILKEVKLLAKRGVKEIIYVAQDTTAHPDFTALLRKTSKMRGIHWIRILYAHPKHITDALIDEIARNRKICKYIDLPLQHICDSILMKMNRGVTRSAVESLIYKLRRKIKGLAVRTSLIVGFPGESDKDFKELVDFVKKVKFERLGVFKYSKEDGTPAANMRGQVPEKIKSSRFHTLMSLQKKVSRELNGKLAGKTIEVLLEKKAGRFIIGRSMADAPEIDCSVKVSNAACGVPGFVKARVIKARAYDLAAVCVT